jgi:hypothetical protein
MKDTKENRVTYALTKVTRFYNPAIDYMIILPVQGPVLPVLHQVPVPQALPHQGPEPQVLPVLQELQLSVLPASVLPCSLLLRWIKKPIKAH